MARPIRLWKLEDGKSLTAPQFLPDVMLTGDDRDVLNPTTRYLPGAINEHESKLGRFIVEDAPIPPNLQNIQGQRRFINMPVEGRYIRMPSAKVPEVVFDKVMQRKEPDFMEQLRQMKLANQPCMQYQEVCPERFPHKMTKKSISMKIPEEATKDVCPEKSKDTGSESVQIEKPGGPTLCEKPMEACVKIVDPEENCTEYFYVEESS